MCVLTTVHIPKAQYTSGYHFFVCVQSSPTPAHDLLSSLPSSPVLLGVDMGVVVGVGWALLVVDVGVAVLLAVNLRSTNLTLIGLVVALPAEFSATTLMV